MNTTFLIATLTTLVAGTLMLRFYFHKVNRRVWLLGPSLIAFLFTITSAGIILNPGESINAPDDLSSATITIDLSSSRAIISDMVHQALGERNRGGIPKVQGIDMSESENGFLVAIRFCIDADSSGSLVRHSAQADVCNVAKVLYRSGVPIAHVEMTGTFPLEDPYGFVRETEVLKLSLSSATDQQINWDTIRYDDLFNLLDSVWWHPSICAFNLKVNSDTIKKQKT